MKNVTPRGGYRKAFVSLADFRVSKVNRSPDLHLSGTSLIVLQTKLKAESHKHQRKFLQNICTQDDLCSGLFQTKDYHYKVQIYCLFSTLLHYFYILFHPGFTQNNDQHINNKV